MANDSPKRRDPPAVVYLIWAVFVLIMWGWAILGTLYVVLGVLCFFVDLGGIIDIGAQDVPTRQKLTSIAWPALMGIVGISFIWLRRCGYLKYGPEAEKKD
jgi:hypothetical protein